MSDTAGLQSFRIPPCEGSGSSKRLRAQQSSWLLIPPASSPARSSAWMVDSWLKESATGCRSNTRGGLTRNLEEPANPRTARNLELPICRETHTIPGDITQSLGIGIMRIAYAENEVLADPPGEARA